MAQAKQGDTVHVHYTGKLGDGTVFDTSRERYPLQFNVGKGAVIAGFEQAVVGMKVGESKTVTIPVDQAYRPAARGHGRYHGPKPAPCRPEPISRPAARDDPGRRPEHSGHGHSRHGHDHDP